MGAMGAIGVAIGEAYFGRRLTGEAGWSTSWGWLEFHQGSRIVLQMTRRHPCRTTQRTKPNPPQLAKPTHPHSNTHVVHTLFPAGNGFVLGCPPHPPACFLPVPPSLAHSFHNSLRSSRTRALPSTRFSSGIALLLPSSPLRSARVVQADLEERRRGCETVGCTFAPRLVSRPPRGMVRRAPVADDDGAALGERLHRSRDELEARLDQERLRLDAECTFRPKFYRGAVSRRTPRKGPNKMYEEAMEKVQRRKEMHRERDLRGDADCSFKPALNKSSLFRSARRSPRSPMAAGAGAPPRGPPRGRHRSPPNRPSCAPLAQRAQTSIAVGCLCRRRRRAKLRRSRRRRAAAQRNHRRFSRAPRCRTHPPSAVCPSARPRAARGVAARRPRPSPEARTQDTSAVKRAGCCNHQPAQTANARCQLILSVGSLVAA